MSSVTLLESAKLDLDDLVIGVIENIITVNKMYQVLPMDGIDGNALAYNRENVLGAVATVGVGNTDGVIGAGASGTNSTARAAAKDPASFTQVSATLTTIMGDAEVNGLIQATRSGMNNQTAVQIASKAKSAGRKFQDSMINGDGTLFTFPGMIALCASGQQVASTGGNGDALSFATMDSVMDAVTDKDGSVDYLTMHARTIRSYKALLRALGGANISEVVQLPSGDLVPSYSGSPIFRNDYIPTTLTQAGGTNLTTFFAGTWDDGSRQHGIAGLTAAEAVGIQVVDVGESETKDERIWRVKWYCGMALFSEKGLAQGVAITN